jgi:hypothetical protein
MNQAYKHLNKETNEFIERVQDLEWKQFRGVNLDWINDVHFVHHPRSISTLDEYTEVFDEIDSMDRNKTMSGFCDSIAIAGPTGTGKTETYHEFERRYPEWHDERKGHLPVARAILRDSANARSGLFMSLLEGLNSLAANPFANRRTIPTVAYLENQVIWNLKHAGVKVFVIDEFQHLLDRDRHGNYILGRHTSSLVNDLKRTLEHANVALIPMGTPPMRMVLEFDPQFAERCSLKETTTFHNWGYDDEFKRFVAGYGMFMPFKEPSGFNRTRIARKIFEKIKAFEFIDTGRILTNTNFKNWVLDNKQKYSKNGDADKRKKWKKEVIDDSLYHRTLNDDDLKKFIDPDEKLRIRTNLRRVVKYMKKLARRALGRKMDCITEELIDETPF